MSLAAHRSHALRSNDWSNDLCYLLSSRIVCWQDITTSVVNHVIRNKIKIEGGVLGGVLLSFKSRKCLLSLWTVQNLSSCRVTTLIMKWMRLTNRCLMTNRNVVCSTVVIGQWVIHDCIPYDLIQGHGHLKCAKMADFKGAILRWYACNQKIDGELILQDNI